MSTPQPAGPAPLTPHDADALTANPRWRDGYEAAAESADPVVGPGVDGREATSDGERAVNATRAFDPPFVAVWDEDIDFDLESFYSEDSSIRPQSVDLEEVTTHGAWDEVVPALQLLRTTADASIREMRDLLVSPTHYEGRVTAFLTTWNFEQHWIGKTLAAIEGALSDREVRAGTEQPSDPLLSWRFRVDSHTRSIGVATRTNLLGEDVVTLHMAQGLLDARVLAVAFRNLAARGGNRELARVADAVAHRQDVYAAFFRAQLLARLAQSGGARLLLRAWARTGRWAWPGTRYRTRAEVADALGILLGGPSGRAAVERIDAEFAHIADPRGGTDNGTVLTPVRGHLRRYGFGSRHTL